MQFGLTTATGFPHPEQMLETVIPKVFLISDAVNSSRRGQLLDRQQLAQKKLLATLEPGNTGILLPPKFVALVP